MLVENAGTYLRRKELLIVLAAGAFLSIYGGPPYHHPDGVVQLRRVLLALQEHGDYRYFQYPGLVVYTYTALYGLIFLLLEAFGRLASLADFEVLWRQGLLIQAPWKVSFYFPAQLVTVLFSLLGVFVTYLLTQRLTNNKTVSFLAALFLATSLLWVSDSHYSTVDVPLASLCVLCVYGSIVISANGPGFALKRSLLAGLLLGLVVSTKYNGVMVFASTFLAGLLMPEGRHLKFLRHVSVILLASAATFLVLNPFAIIDFRRFYLSMVAVSRHTAIWGHLGYETQGPSWLFHITHSLYYGYGLLPMIFAAVGVVWVILTPNLPKPAKAAMLAFPAVYFFVNGCSRLAHQRFMIPLLPFLAICSGLGIYALYKLLRKVRVGGVMLSPMVAASLLSILVAISLYPRVRDSIMHDLLLTELDTRQQLREMLSQVNRPRSNMTVYAANTTLWELVRAGFASQEEILTDFTGEITTGADVIILDSFGHDRYIYTFREEVRRMRFGDCGGFEVVQINPYKQDKECVPFSPKSRYSPYPPDLKFRVRPGPFIEIYSKDKGIVDALMRAAADKNMDNVSLVEPGRCYYLNRIGHK